MLKRWMKGLLAGLCLMGMAGGAMAAEPVKAEIFVQLGHSDSVNSVAFSPDGLTVVSGSSDNALKLWDVASGRELRTLNGHGYMIMSVAFSPDGRTIVSGSRNRITLWDVASGRELRTLNGHNWNVMSVAFSPDGRTVVSGSKDKTLKLWDVASGQVLRTLSGHSDVINSVAFSPDGRTIASGSKDKILKLWDVASGRELRKLSGHSDGINSVAFSPDGLTIVSGSWDKTLKLWDVASGSELRTLSGLKASITSVAFSPDGRTLISGSFDKTIKLWDVASGQELLPLNGHKGIVNSVAFSPDGLTAVSGSWDKTLKLWDVSNKRELRTLSGHNDRVNSVAFSPDGRTIVSDSYNNTHSLWDVASGRKLRTLNGHSSYIKNVAFSPDGRTVVSFYILENTLKLTDVASGRELRTLNGHSDWIESVAFSPDGRSIVSGSKDKTLKLWDVTNGREMRTMNGHSDGIESVAFSPDGRTIVSGSFDDTLKLWNVASGQELYTLNGHGGIVYSVAFSPNGHLIISGSTDNTLKLWDVAGGQELRTLKGHQSGVTSVAFSPDGKEIISGSFDSTVRRWNTATGAEIAQYVSFDDGEWVTITPEGYFDASENGDKHLNIRIGNTVSGIDQYRESFYRPDLVKLALSGGSIKEFRNIATVKSAPSVQIVKTAESTNEAEASVTLKLTDTGGGIGDVRLYLNGSAVVLDNSRALKRVVQDDANSTLRTYTLKLVNGKNSLRAIAFNADNSMQSTDALYEISAAFKVAGKPSLHAIVVGINEFKNPKLQLKYPVADAQLFAETLRKSATGLFEKVEIKMLTSKEETTSGNIKNELTAMRTLNPDDLFVFYVASHGTVDDGEYFLITSNVGSTSTERLKADSLPQNEMKELIANIPTTKKVIVLDTCNSGALGDALQSAMLTRGMSEDTAIKILSRAVGSTILSASTSTQEALEGYKEHGLFTYVLAEGMSGKADKGRSGFIKTTDLADYVDSEVPELAEKIFKRAQYPNISISGQPFHLGKVGTP